MPERPLQTSQRIAANVSSPCVPDPGRVIDSRDLLSGHGEILIRHGADHYRLRHTRNGKLILTK